MDRIRTGFVARVVVTSILFLIQPGCALLKTAPPDPTADNLRLTSLNAPLSREALKARITFAYQAPQRFYAGERISLRMLVENMSGFAWPYTGQPDGKYQVRLGNRWLDQNGTTLDDGRGNLSYDLGPSDQEEVLIVVTAPERRGEYLLEFDMVQEQVAWFGQAGSETLRVKVIVQ